MQKWFNNFTPQQARFHKELVRKIVQDSQEKTELILDSCYIGAILEHTGMDLKDCIEIAKKANGNMEETSQYLNKERGYYDMINDEKLRTKIREEAKGLLGKGFVMSRGVTELKKTHKVPVKDLTIIWAEGKEEIKADAEKTKVELNTSIKQAEKKVAEEFKENMKKVFPVTEKEIEEAQKESLMPTQSEMNAELNKSGHEFKTPSKLKIIEQITKVEGEYGTYSKSSNGVSDSSKTFKDTKDLDDYKKDVEKEFKTTMEEIDKQLSIWNEKKQNLASATNKKLNKIVEIEQVFSM